MKIVILISLILVTACTTNSKDNNVSGSYENSKNAPTQNTDLDSSRVVIKEMIKQNIVSNNGLPGHESYFPSRDSFGAVEQNTESYDGIVENEYANPLSEPLSTFSIDVDTASYSNMRRFLSQNQLPPKDSVRIEELINYFSYNYPLPQSDAPFSRITEVAECPWNEDHWLVQVGIQGYKIEQEQLPPCNLVFLIDVSGSMSNVNKLPLLKTAMGLLADKLRPQDTMSIVVYAGAAGLALPPTSGDDKRTIMRSLNQLQAGGSTNGGAGIQLAYDVAQENYVPDGINRVILATDGDFNVGVSSRNGLLDLIEGKRQSNVFLTVLGFGMGNLKDGHMEQLANKGNGTYAYIDTLAEARKVLVHELGSTLFTIAKDVKIQVEFNPNYVANYRLVGYENRLLAAEDFNDDTKDAGEIGAGHTVTALYEIIPQPQFMKPGRIDPLKYQEQPKPTVSQGAYNDEILTLKVRYKAPEEDTSRLLTDVLKIPVSSIENTSTSFRFSAAVATFGLMLRDSPHKNNASLELAKSLAMSARGEDRHGYRKEFIDLIGIADALMKMKNY